MPDDPRQAPGLGRRLRRARQARRSTLADVAAAAGLTKGFLSKLERDQSTASVASLLRLCEVLDMSVGELFGEADDDGLIRRDAYRPINFGGAGMVEHLLTPSREKRLQVIHSVLAPSGGSGAEAYTLPLDVEFVFVIDGSLEVDVDGQVMSLHAGDALTFSPQTPHAFRNPSPDGEARVLWALTPALPSGERRQ